MGWYQRRVHGVSGGNSGGLGFSADAEVGFPGQGFLNTALTVVFALVGFSLLVNLIAKILAVDFVANFFNKEGRSLDAETISTYTNLAINGIQRMRDLYEQLE